MGEIAIKDRTLIKLSFFLMGEKWLQNNPVMKEIKKILINNRLLLKKNKYYPKKVI